MLRKLSFTPVSVVFTFLAVFLFCCMIGFNLSEGSGDWSPLTTILAMLGFVVIEQLIINIFSPRKALVWMVEGIVVAAFFVFLFTIFSGIEC